MVKFTNIEKKEIYQKRNSNNGEHIPILKRKKLVTKNNNGKHILIFKRKKFMSIEKNNVRDKLKIFVNQKYVA